MAVRTCDVAPLVTYIDHESWWVTHPHRVRGPRGRRFEPAGRHAARAISASLSRGADRTRRNGSLPMRKHLKDFGARVFFVGTAAL